jgi:hypothetical protein
MIDIDDKIVSFEIFKKHFVCDLNACKGACCVDGDSGAPLIESEKQELESIFPAVEKYMRPEGIDAIRKQGKYVIDKYGELTTPLVNQAECAYVYFETNGTAKCAIEKAYKNGDVSFYKPISCHLYPIRITEYKNFDALNYHKWHVCEPACRCGSELQVPIYKFVKPALVRKYGKDWYEKLEIAAEFLEKEQ